MLVPCVSTPLVDDAAVGGEAVARADRDDASGDALLEVHRRAGRDDLAEVGDRGAVLRGEDALGVDHGLGEPGLLRLERR